MKRLFYIIIAAVFFFTCTACGAKPLGDTRMMLDTVCSVTLYDGASTELLDDCFSLIEAREALWSRTVADSEISLLNAAKGQTVTVSEDTAALLQTARFYTAVTDGAFDITTAKLTDVWKAASGKDAIDDAALAAALEAVGAQHITVSGCDVTLPENVNIDLGGIAKGAIADEVCELLKAGGCDSALVDLGGNIVALGSKPDGKPFHIGIAHPTKDGELIATVAVSDKAVVTSGSYERTYTVGGTVYSHILDPKTGYPADSDLLSVTIIAPLGIDADALSTACYVLGYERTMTLLDSYSDIDAVFVRADGSVTATDGVVLI